MSIVHTIRARVCKYRVESRTSIMPFFVVLLSILLTPQVAVAGCPSYSISPLDSQVDGERVEVSEYASRYMGMVVCVEGHQQLTQGLKTASQIGRGEMGVVYGFPSIPSRVLKIPHGGGSIGDEYRQHPDLTRFLAGSGVRVPGIQRAKIHYSLHDKTRNALIKQRVIGSTLDQLAPDKLVAVRAAASGFMTHAIRKSMSPSEPSILRDFKLSNFMWGTFAEDPSGTPESLIPIDVQCMPKTHPNVLYEQTSAAVMKHYVREVNIINKWQDHLGCLEFDDPGIRTAFQP